MSIVVTSVALRGHWLGASWNYKLDLVSKTAPLRKRSSNSKGPHEVTGEKDEFGRKELPVWAFKSRQRSEHKTWPSIVYGQLPNEFVQTFPKQGNPLPLVEGKIYGVHATIYGTSGDNVWFIVKEGKASRIAKPE